MTGQWRNAGATEASNITPWIRSSEGRLFEPERTLLAPAHAAVHVSASTFPADHRISGTDLVIIEHLHMSFPQRHKGAPSLLLLYRQCQNSVDTLYALKTGSSASGLSETPHDSGNILLGVEDSRVHRRGGCCCCHSRETVTGHCSVLRRGSRYRRG